MGIPMSDNLLWLHGKTRSADGTFAGTVICAGGAEASALYLDSGQTYSTEFQHAEGWGVHIYVTVAFLTTTAIHVDVVHAAGAPTTTKIIGGRTFVAADLTVGKHYFIPFYSGIILEMLGIYCTPSTNPTAGMICAWVGQGAMGAE